MNFNGGFNLIMGEKKPNIYFESLFMSYENNYGFYKEIIKFSELRASIVFKDSFGMKKTTFIRFVNEI